MNARVHLCYETDRFGNPHGSSHIRLLRPFSHPVLSNSFRITWADGLPSDGVDVVLVERGWRADTTLEAAEQLVSGIRALGAKLIYTLDDNLLDLHSCQPWHEFSTDTKRNIVRFFLRQADGVVVSTEPLRQRLSQLNQSIHVVPNALDERLFLPDSGEAPVAGRSVSSEQGEVVTIGYMGTHSHLQDLMMIMEPLRAVLRDCAGKVEFQLVGVSDDNRIVRSFDSLPFKVVDVQGNHFYPDFVPWARKNLRWDLAIAPLEDNSFTRCKSDIKFLDYSMLGIPGIYSNVNAYRDSVAHGETGVLCDNHPDAWRDAMMGMIDRSEPRQRMAGKAYGEVSSRRLLCHCAINWKSVIMRTVA